MTDPILVARHGDIECHLLPALANRHGLITGATGTGKTITLQTLAENFSQRGVPVFMADVKGDLTGITQTGALPDKVRKILKDRGLPEPAPTKCPSTLWDVYGEQGHPVRATVSDMGPLLLSRMLSLNDTQAGVLSIVFKIADDNGLALLDLKDLRAMLQHVGENAKQFTTEYGNVSVASVGAIQRGLLQIEEQGGEHFFGEPMLDIQDFIQTVDGQGVVNILTADRLLNAPRLYATFLLWMLSELFETLPEVGDLDKPKLVFFFDEAHLLFNDAPKALVERIELVVRLVRSKGVGVYFVTQNPLDIPDSVLGQLGNRVQHALRAFTPRDQKAVKTAAETFVQNPALDVVATLSQLGTGEALVSTLQDKGIPSPVQKTLVAPPRCRMGSITEAERAQVRAGSPVGMRYDTAINRESAAEILAARAQQAAEQAQAPTARDDDAQSGGFGQKISDMLFGSGRKQGVVQSVAKQTTRNVGGSIGRSVGSAIGESVLGKTGKKFGGQIGNQIVRGILGSIFGGRR